MVLSNYMSVAKMKILSIHHYLLLQINNKIVR